MTMSNNSMEDLTNDFKDYEERSNKDITLERTLEELFSKNNIAMKSDLNTRQISSLARGLVFSEKYNNKTMASFINHLMELSVSKNRQGRAELVSVVQSGNDSGVDESARLLDRLLGR